MGASQCISITFGPWFEDEFGFSSAGLIAVIIALGVFELVSSVGSARVTDTWGKEISVRRGAVLMVVATIVMAACTQLSFVAVPMLIIFILGFEFAIVSMLPLGSKHCSHKWRHRSWSHSWRRHMRPRNLQHCCNIFV
jgi:predicted MFS family arabinose efflux permease